jgi:hypothetical protein
VQVTDELKKMTAFIRQEALEKAREIQIKADEVNNLLFNGQELYLTSETGIRN